MNAENTKNFLMVLDKQSQMAAAFWEKSRQEFAASERQIGDQAANRQEQRKGPDLLKIKETMEQAGKTLVEYINRFASGLEQLGTRARKAGTDAENLKALEYGAAQTGLSNEAVAGAFQTIINSPETLLAKLGVTRGMKTGKKKKLARS